MTGNRQVQVGLLPAHAELRIPVHPPMGDQEEPVVFCQAGDVIVTKPSADLVVLRSTVPRVAGYVLVYVPSSVVRLARVPWAEVVRQGGTILRTIMADVGVGAKPQSPK